MPCSFTQACGGCLGAGGGVGGDGDGDGDGGGDGDGDGDGGGGGGGDGGGGGLRSEAGASYYAGLRFAIDEALEQALTS